MVTSMLVTTITNEFRSLPTAEFVQYHNVIIVKLHTLDVLHDSVHCAYIDFCIYGYLRISIVVCRKR